MTTTDVAFVPATIALRPPRVAILMRDDHQWREWAMRSLTIASDYWGGGGFILVPYDPETGVPASQFIEIVRAYDPDHVVTLEIGMSDLEAWYPGSIQFTNVEDEGDRLSLISGAHTGVNDELGRHAREVVASWCSPLRSIRLGRDEAVRQRETMTQLGRAGRSDRYQRGLPVAPVGTDVSRIAASAEWRSDAGISSAARVGVANAEPFERPEPQSDVLHWLIARTSDTPTSLIWSNASQPPESSLGLESWFRDEQGLIQVSRSYLRDGAAVVVGDTGTDFALALAYDRILGRGIWLTPAMLADDVEFKLRVRPAVWTLISDLEHSASRLAVSSTSLTSRQLDIVSERLQESDFDVQIAGKRVQRAHDSETVQVRFAEVDQGYLDYVVNDHIGTSVVIPMSMREDGSHDAMTGLDTPVPTELLYPEASANVPYWYVDVSLARDNSPRGRDLPASALAIEEGAFQQVNVRASKEGITFNPSSMGFVPSGALLRSRLGRPRLRSLSVRAWVEAMAELDGLGVRLSTPGRHAELVRRRLGSRKLLLDLVAGSSLRMLREFIPRGESPKKRDPETVVLGLEPYLSFTAIDALLPGVENETVAVIDSLVSARLLRRGLILGCQDCGRPSFLVAEKLGQEYECPQCGTMNLFVSERWRKGTEPKWFYDLFATFRELLAYNGDVPLLAAARLQAEGRGYADTPELEFFDRETGQGVAEIDVIASVNREVVIVEAKVSGEFPAQKRGEQTRKLLRVANALRADRIVLATTQDHWKPADVAHLTREAAKATPFACQTQVLAGLGSPPRPA